MDPHISALVAQLVWPWGCLIDGPGSNLLMIYDTVAEWLRRSTRNRLGLSRVGSSPASVDTVLLFATFTTTFVGRAAEGRAVLSVEVCRVGLLTSIIICLVSSVGRAHDS